MIAGLLAVLCAGALAWYYRSMPEPVPGNPPPEAARSEPKTPGDKAEAAVADDAGRFEFYEMLPDAEVAVPEQPATSGRAAPPPVSIPGSYVVQAGAFPEFAEADKVKARLALLGIVSEIQAAEANGARFHRVRIGPIDDLEQLNRLRARLLSNGIEYLVIPVGE